MELYIHDGCILLYYTSIKNRYNSWLWIPYTKKQKSKHRRPIFLGTPISNDSTGQEANITNIYTLSVVGYLKGTEDEDALVLGSGPDTRHGNHNRDDHPKIRHGVACEHHIWQRQLRQVIQKSHNLKSLKNSSE